MHVYQVLVIFEARKSKCFDTYSIKKKQSKLTLSLLKEHHKKEKRFSFFVLSGEIYESSAQLEGLVIHHNIDKTVKIM